MSSSSDPQSVPGGTKVLVVDDHSDTVVFLSRLLQKAGCEVTSATGLREALTLLANERFDLLISDLGLADGNGNDLMRQAQQHQQIKGIALSGFDSADARRECEQAGFSEHVVKPVDMPKLLQAMQRVLHR